LKWTTSTDPDKWQVQYKPVNLNAEWTGIKVNGTSRYVRLLTLIANQKYKWRIRAKCDTTWTAYSNEESFTTLPSSLENAFGETLPGLSITPNPSTGLLAIQYKSVITGGIMLKVYDQAGKEVFTRSTSVIKGNNTYHLDLFNVAMGMYYLELINNDEKSGTTFVIEK
jgi:hypothetical protein